MTTNRTILLENYGDEQLSKRLKAPRPASASARTDRSAPMIMSMKKKYGNYIPEDDDEGKGNVDNNQRRQPPFLYKPRDATQLRDGFRQSSNNTINDEFEEVR